METMGYVLPETAAEAREIHATLRPTAGELVREIAVAIGLDGEAYRSQVTEDVRRTAQDALFGSLLVVHTADRDTFDGWCDEPPYAAYDVHLEGSEHVASVAWHPAPATQTIAATTYQDAAEAAMATLRRIAWGRIYRPLLDGQPEDS